MLEERAISGPNDDAYLDNTIVSGLVNGDLEPPSEQPAAEALLEMHERGEIRLCTSHVTKEELAALPAVHRTPKEAMYDRVMKLPEVPETRTDSGMMLMGVGGGTRPHPVLTELRHLLPDEADARHIFQAATNDVPVFVTTDRATILRHAGAIEAEIGIRVVPPSALLAECRSR